MPGSAEWLALVEHVKQQSPDIFLINEMPFGRWIAQDDTPSDDVFDQSVRLHDDGFADTHETVSMRLVLENTGDAPLTHVVVTLTTESPPVECHSQAADCGR